MAVYILLVLLHASLSAAPSMIAPESLWQIVRCLRGFAHEAVLAAEEHAVVLQCEGVYFSKNWRSSCPEAGPVVKPDSIEAATREKTTRPAVVGERATQSVSFVYVAVVSEC